MAGAAVPFTEIERAVKLWHQALSDGYPSGWIQGGTCSACRVVHEQLGLGGSSLRAVERRLDTAVALGIPVREWRSVEPDWADAQRRRYERQEPDYRSKRSKRPAVASQPRRARPEGELERTPPAPPPSATPSGRGTPTIEDLIAQVAPALRRGGMTLEEFANRLQVDQLAAEGVLLAAQARGVSIYNRSGIWQLDKPDMGSQRSHDRQLVSDADGVIRFAAVGDTHLGSKYSREDCLSDFYNHVVRRQLSVVLHAGNWVEGEARFNKHDLLVHGMDAQLRYLAEHYPQRQGVETWAVTGDDHEGWYAQREGVDIGRYAQNVMQQHGRTDWCDMGYMECFIDLVHRETGKHSKLLLMHPGGGSAYAISYAPQKIVEGFDGGDKPAVLILGHYHKASYNLIRNVHTLQVGCFQDQTVFMRKQKLSAHLAGAFVEVRLDPDTGAVIEFTTTFRNYFVRDYYRNRWSHHGPVEHAPRSA